MTSPSPPSRPGPAAEQVDTAEVRRFLGVVVSELNQDLMGISVAIQRRLADHIADLGAAHLDELMLASVQGNVENILHSLEHDISPERVEPPSAALEYSRRLAQRGVPVDALVRAYRLGQQRLLEMVFDRLARLPADPEVRNQVQQQLVARTFDYIDWMSQQVIRVYADEAQRWQHERDTQRSVGVARVLSGDLDDPVAAEALTGWRFDRPHLGLVAWAGEATGPVRRPDDLIRSLLARAGIDLPVLAVSQDRRTVWAWVAPGTEVGGAELTARLRSATPPAGISVAVGDVAGGISGFRESHAQASAAQRVGMLATTDRAVLAWSDPGLGPVALLCADPSAMRSWVASTLGPLAGAEEGCERLRTTLLEWLRSSESHVATAERLHLHRNSVKYRIARAKEMLPRPLADDRLSVELALAACEWLGGAALPA